MSELPKNLFGEENENFFDHNVFLINPTAATLYDTVRSGVTSAEIPLRKRRTSTT